MHLTEELQPLWQAHLEAQTAAEEGADVVSEFAEEESSNRSRERA